eukprot:TRINITY_DN1372_c0_g1_i5.p1 TRINITY_DN1372_c0_g1~~TRINITY_DN1372_c0_g1_i5.p1  ORF type:complete len:260 (+),score=27.40 TRINITY_DN1372_c0_g1_i5:247-1026(+)
MKANPIIQKFSITGCMKEREDVMSVCSGLRENKMLQEVNMTGNYYLGAESLSIICDSLKGRNLTKLDLSSNHMQNRGERLCELLLACKDTLQYLDLNGCKLSAKDMKPISQDLLKLTSLTHLDLHDNGFGESGMKHLAKSLAVCKTITTVHFKSIDIGPRGAKYLTKALTANPSMTDIDISYNSIANKGAKCIAKVLKVNKMIKRLIVSHNFIFEAGGKVLGEALRGCQDFISCDMSGNFISQMTKNEILSYAGRGVMV